MSFDTVVTDSSEAWNLMTKISLGWVLAFELNLYKLFSVRVFEDEKYVYIDYTLKP